MAIVLLNILFLLLTATLLTAEDNTTAVKPTDNTSKIDNQSSARVDTPRYANTIDFDIVLLMDSSGSMRKTDPEDFRKHSARLFVSLLGKNDRIAVVSFGDTAKVLAPLTQNNHKGRQLLSQAIAKITSSESTTHINLAIKQGLKLLENSDRQNRTLLLLSDGKLTLGDEDKEKEALAEIEALLEQAQKKGIKIYSIAFTEHSDLKLLDMIARQTHGFSRLAQADKDLHVMFADIFEGIKGPDTIPIERDEFIIDSEIKEAIVIISKTKDTNVILIDPKGKKHTYKSHPKTTMKWVQAKAFDMITITEPSAGTWKVNLTLPHGNKIYVITNLSLQGSLQKNQFSIPDNVTFSVWLQRDKYPINEPDVIDKVQFKAEVLAPDNKTHQVSLFKSQDNKTYGRFTVNYPLAEAGEYKITITATADTFVRQKTFIITASKPAVTAPVPQVDNVTTKPKEAQDGMTKTWITFGIINGVIILLIAIYFGTKKLVVILKRRKGKNAKV